MTQSEYGELMMVAGALNDIASQSRDKLISKQIEDIEFRIYNIIHIRAEAKPKRRCVNDNVYFIIIGGDK